MRVCLKSGKALGAQGIGGMRSSPGAERWGRSDSGVPQSPVFFGLGICSANSLTEKNAPFLIEKE
jgi:hypothetical protein